MFQSRWIEVAARWILGLTFVYASYHKITAPAEFAKMIYGYGLFPGMIINLTAIILPFVELFAGMALLVGFYDRGANVILIALLGLFIIFISINLIRGHEFDCGCFAENTFFAAESPWTTLVRDIFLLAMGAYIHQFRDKKSRFLTMTRPTLRDHSK